MTLLNSTELRYRSPPMTAPLRFDFAFTGHQAPANRRG